MPAPILMVHGAFCRGSVFDAFKAPFEAMGHLCVSPDLPGHGPGETASGLSMTDYAAAVVRHIEAFETPPVLIGHSMGGLVAQMAAAKARVSALCLLSPSAPWGVSGGSMEEAAQAIGMMGLGAYWTGSVDPDFSLFAGTSADRLDRAGQKAAFARLVPESGRALHEVFNWWLDPFMTTAAAAPLGGPPALVVAGGKDRVHSPSLVRQSAQRCGAEFHLVEDMSHWLIAEPGYEEIAGAVLRWLPSSAKAAA